MPGLHSCRCLSPTRALACDIHLRSGNPDRRLRRAGREYIHIQRLTEQCLAAGIICRFSPEPFTRFGIYMFIAMAQAFLLFTVGAAIEHRKENRAFSAAWRR